VLQNDLNALSKMAKLFNLLWHEAKCSCCKGWSMDDYLSAGSYRPAKAILDRRKRDGILQESAAGAAKAIGKRNVSVTDKQRALTSKAMLLRQNDGAAMQRPSTTQRAVDPAVRAGGSRGDGAGPHVERHLAAGI